MKTIFLTLLLWMSVFSLQAQWLAKQSLPANAKRTFASAFAVNGKIYLVGGQASFTGLADVWEYDVATDSWTQKNPFPGGVRGGTMAFAIGNRGYLTCGSNYVGQYFNDVWEYNPSTDSWTQKNNFPGMPREEGVAFVIGNKAYAGTGYEEVVGPNSTSFFAFGDFYEYDPAIDSWTTKAALPAALRGWAIGAALGGKGYVGLGSNAAQNGSFNDFYEYDPQTDTWTAKASHATAVGDATAFALGQKLFVCGGFNFGSSVMYNSMRSYNPATNTWSVEASLPAGPNAGAVAVVSGSRAFLGTGYTAAFSERLDWWEFSQPTATSCPAPVAFSTSTFATSGAAQCDGKIVVSNPVNGCAPYTCTVVSGTGTVSAAGFTVNGLCAGSYSVYVSDGGCCGTSRSTCVVTANAATGISGFAGVEAAWLIIPNPNQGSFHVNIDPEVVSAQDICVLDPLGRRLPAGILPVEKGFDLSLPRVKPGLYLLQVTIGGSCVYKRIMVE